MAEKKIVSQRTFIDPSKTGSRRSANTGSEYQGTKDAEWNCNSCGHGPIKGNVKICPTCGNPKDNSETYFHPEESAPFLSEKEMTDRGVDLDHGSDEECPYCQAKIAPKTQICPQCNGTIVNVGKTDRICPNCRRETSNSICASCGENTIRKSVQPRGTIPSVSPVYLSSPQNENSLSPKTRPFSWLTVVAPIAGIAILIFGLVMIFSPREKVGVVTSNSWSCSVPVEQYQYNQHTDWFVPSGGDYVSQVQAIHHYDQVYVRTDRICNDEWEVVGSHTETTTEQVCETHSEYSGTTETCYDDGTCSYSDNYENVTDCHSEPVTETVSDYGWVEHCRDEDIYEQVPVYQPKYTYNIWEWTQLAPLTSSGSDSYIICPTVNSTNTYHQASQEKISCETIFTVDSKKNYIEKPNCQTTFPDYKIGSQWLLTLTGPIVKSIEPIP